MKTRWLGFLALVALLILACASAPPILYQQEYQQARQVVARATGGVEFTMADVYRYLYHKQSIKGGGVLEAEKVRPYLDSMLIDTLIGMEADSLQLDQYYSQHRVYRNRYNEFLRRTYLRRRLFDMVEPDSATVAAFYFDRPDLHQVPEQVLVWQILSSGPGLLAGPDSARFKGLTDKELHEAAGEYIQEIYDLLDSPDQFEEIARQYSHDATVDQTGGKVGWAPHEYYLDPFDSVAFSTPVGEYSRPYADADGWHILFIERYQPEGIPPLDSAQYQLALYNCRMTEVNRMNSHLRDSILSLPCEIVYNEAILDTNLHLVEPGVWAAIVNRTDSIEFYDLRGLEERVRKERGVDNTTVEMKREMIQLLSEEVLLTQTARGAGVDTLPEVREQEARLRHEHSKAVALQRLSDDSWEPSDSMVAAYFDTHQAQFQVEYPLTLRQIIVGDSSLGLLVRDQIISGMDFDELAMQYHAPASDDSRSRIEIGPVAEGDIPAEIWEQARLTMRREATYPVKTSLGYHVVQVVERQDPRDLGQAGPEIRRHLRLEHATALIDSVRDELYSRYQVQFPNPVLPVHLRPQAQRVDPLHDAE